ncbi:MULTISPECIES: AAA family ATPase [Brevibacterium]|uniref:AAA family ATPase n=1 Tax=Brevibacterium casei TaxID=33889 RepID=A0A7T3ZWR1_9MICO|nr:AAA family ATPase [Brevibacterium casei]QQB13068.1 AAA family ATPase [Brevibacterium casei]
MRLHSIRLQNYRGITDATVEFSAGVTIVEGPNEVGKSSIHEAITHLREDKASSKKASIKDLQPIGVDAGPEVELHLTSGDIEMTYAKRWLRGPSTTLSILRPHPEQLSGDEAHERFAAILADTVDVDLLVALDVAQGESLAQAPMAQISALQSALGETGVEVADHDAFLERVDVEYAKHFTKSGRPTGEYGELQKAVPLAAEALASLVDRSENLDALVDRHARATARLESVRDGLARALSEREDADAAFAAVAELRTAVDAAEERTEAARREAALAADAVERRTTLLAEATAAETAVETAQTAASDLESSHAQRDAAFEAAQQLLGERRTALDDARERTKRASRDVARARARGEVTSLRARLDEIRTLEDTRNRARAVVGSIAVTTADVDRLVGLDTEVRIASGAKRSAAAQVRVTRLGETPIAVDGADIAAEETGEVAVVDDVRIAITGIADITVSPGASPVDLDRAVTTAERALTAEMERLGVESLDQAREQANRRADAEAVVTETTATLTALLGRDKRDDLDAKLARAEALIAGDGSAEDAQAESAREERTAEDAASVDELEEIVAEADAAADAAQTAVTEAEADLERTRAVRDESRVDTVRAQTTLQEARTQSERLQAAVAAAQADHSDESLAAALDAARARAEEAEAALGKARAAYEAADPETLEARRDNARKVVADNEAQQTADRQEVDQLTALIDDRLSEGIFEKVGAARETLETAEARLARVERSAQAIALLRSTVYAHKAEAQRKYVAPFKEQIERLGRMVFGPTFAVEVSEDLEIASRTLDGTTVPFDSLSGGTKEQLSLIGRLAVAALVDPQTGAPVILDDAFGFADPKRLAALNVILGRIGETAQVVLLTCQPDRFARVGGASRVSLG